MSVWHGDKNKKKPSGGRKRSNRGKRNFELGSFPAETTLGKPKRKIVRRRGGNQKTKILNDKYACVTDVKKGRTVKVEILRIVQNPANIDYDRRGVMTKGTLIDTTKGLARVTSRPGQNGTISAVLIGKRKKR